MNLPLGPCEPPCECYTVLVQFWIKYIFMTLKNMSNPSIYLYIYFTYHGRITIARNIFITAEFLLIKFIKQTKKIG